MKMNAMILRLRTRLAHDMYGTTQNHENWKRILLKSILCLCFFLSVCLSLQAQAAPREVHHVRVYFVQPEHETFTQEEQQSSIIGITHAYQYWQTNGYTKTVEIEPKGILYPNASPYSTILDQWYGIPLVDNDEITTILVVDNQTTLSTVLGMEGYSQEYYNIIAVVLYPFGRSQTYFESVVAHELGHILYHLPDLYYSTCANDIMCYPYHPYKNGFVGCTSLASLGRPCAKYYIPLIMSR